MADAAYDADHLRQAIAAKRALRHSEQPFPRAQAPARQASLCPAPSRRMLLLKAQSFPRVATRFEKSRAKLPGHGHARQPARVKRRQQGLWISKMRQLS